MNLLDEVIAALPAQGFRVSLYQRGYKVTPPDPAHAVVMIRKKAPSGSGAKYVLGKLQRVGFTWPPPRAVAASGSGECTPSVPGLLSRAFATPAERSAGAGAIPGPLSDAEAKRRILREASIVPPVNPRTPLATEDELSTTIETITPERAAALLEKNHDGQRALSTTRVLAFAEDMRCGRWRLTHQGICLDVDGNLVDGQHRMWAIVEAGVPVRMVVTRSRVAQITDPIDRHGVRNVAFLVSMRPRTVAAYNGLRMLEAGRTDGRVFTPGAAEEMRAHHEAAVKAVLASGPVAMLSSNVVAALAWAWPCDGPRVETFAHEVATGLMLEERSPAYVLRRWLERNRRADRWAMLMAACNAIRYALIGKGIKSIYVGDSGYRALTTRRRVLHVPHTPETSAVETMTMTQGVEDGG
jgi:hypothetical protein